MQAEGSHPPGVPRLQQHPELLLISLTPALCQCIYRLSFRGCQGRNNPSWSYAVGWQREQLLPTTSPIKQISWGMPEFSTDQNFWRRQCPQVRAAARHLAGEVGIFCFTSPLSSGHHPLAFMWHPPSQVLMCGEAGHNLNNTGNKNNNVPGNQR